MANYNRVILAGNLTRDPELRYVPSGHPVVHFTLAVNRTFITQQGEKREDVSFIPIVVWGKQAESCNQYLTKGKPVLLEGRIQQRSWITPEGDKRSIIEVVAERVQFLEKRGPLQVESEENMEKEEVYESNKVDEGYMPPSSDYTSNDDKDDVPF